MAKSLHVLVTGSAGRIGRAVVRELKARGHFVRGLDLVGTPGADESVVTDLGDAAAVRLGEKTGAGFYIYAKPGRGADDPALTAMLEKHPKERREIGMEEMTDRLFLPMLTEASRVLSEGIVREPGDVDMGLILGIGFPPFRGGILRWADTVGLPNLLARLKKYEHLGARFQPTEQMRKLAAEGKGFYPDA